MMMTETVTAPAYKRRSLCLNAIAEKIAEILTAEGVITPGVYKYQQGDTRFARYLKDGKNRWCYETVQTILKDQVYVGDMVNHKAEVANYKTKQRVMLPHSERIVVENTHQAIIDRGTG